MWSGLLFTCGFVLASVVQCVAVRCLECTDMPTPADCDTITHCADDSVCFIDSFVTQNGVQQYNLGCRTTSKCNGNVSPGRRNVVDVMTKGRRDDVMTRGLRDDMMTRGRRDDVMTRGLRDDVMTRGLRDDVMTRGLRDDMMTRGKRDEVMVRGRRDDVTVCNKCCIGDFCNIEGCGFSATVIGQQRGPYCFDCKAQSDVDTCRTVVQCQPSDVCSLVNVTNTLGVYTTACIARQQCTAIHNLHNITTRLIGKRGDTHTVCCETDFCNDHRDKVSVTLPPTTTASVTVPPTHIVDAEWSLWGSWSTCTRSCGADGKQSRHRSCTRPPECLGDESETRSCSTNQCPVDGGWTPWGEWTACSVTCGDAGNRQRHRTCDNPPPSGNGKNCSGFSFAQETCNTQQNCPVDGGWTSWGEWTACSATCGDAGNRQRHRTCEAPPPSGNGKNCSGFSFAQETCSAQQNCPVDGGWSDWGPWAACDRTCGSGLVQLRHRACDNPTPTSSGANCMGQPQQSRACQVASCPVDGGWSDWGAWSRCSSTCGAGGTQRRTRACDNPPPADLSHDCPGNAEETRDCQSAPCPVDGAWSGWGDWSNCTKTCGDTGSHIRTRACDSPPPQHNGVTCQGVRTDVKHCLDLPPCQVDGDWGPWTPWSSCTATCGSDGEKIRTRDCDQPRPLHGGLYCPGDGQDVQYCNLDQCDVDGRWSSWGAWSSCPATCGDHVTMVHTRSCDNPAPWGNGKTCDGSNQETEKCNVPTCQVSGVWDEWHPWSSCTQTCGSPALRIRSRICSGDDCPGSSNETEDCIVPAC